MLIKENAIRRLKYTKGKNRYNNYIFKCVGCGKEIEVQPAALKKHSGKCMICVQLKEPYRYIYNELKSHKKEEKQLTKSYDDFLLFQGEPLSRKLNQVFVMKPNKLRIKCLKKWCFKSL
jgi:hypothetical protein